MSIFTSIDYTEVNLTVYMYKYLYFTYCTVLVLQYSICSAAYGFPFVLYS